MAILDFFFWITDIAQILQYISSGCRDKNFARDFVLQNAYEYAIIGML